MHARPSCLSCAASTAAPHMPARRSTHTILRRAPTQLQHSHARATRDAAHRPILNHTIRKPPPHPPAPPADASPAKVAVKHEPQEISPAGVAPHEDASAPKRRRVQAPPPAAAAAPAPPASAPAAPPSNPFSIRNTAASRPRSPSQWTARPEQSTAWLTQPRAPRSALPPTAAARCAGGAAAAVDAAVKDEADAALPPHKPAAGAPHRGRGAKADDPAAGAASRVARADEAAAAAGAAQVADASAQAVTEADLVILPPQPPHAPAAARAPPARDRGALPNYKRFRKAGEPPLPAAARGGEGRGAGEPLGVFLADEARRDAESEAVERCAGGARLQRAALGWGLYTYPVAGCWGSGACNGAAHGGPAAQRCACRRGSRRRAARALWAER
jgi:hypothetical protein